MIVTLWLLAIASTQASETKPNVLFILIDDFGFYDVGYNGSTFYETPRIDQLASEWMRFDSCYTPSPMCSPTRLSILTGKNPARHGVTQWLPGRDKAYVRTEEKPRVYCPPPQSSGIKDAEFSLGEAFQEAGYETAFVGKWHMGDVDEPQRGFDHWVAFRGQGTYYAAAEYQAALEHARGASERELM
ncbi:MAG: sulfatase-like hydrolase/transferase, partial [Verrucomicrobiota bacterium]